MSRTIDAMIDDLSNENMEQGKVDHPYATSIESIGAPGSPYRPRRASASAARPAVVQVATYQRYSADKQGRRSEDRQLERNEAFNDNRIKGVIIRRYTDRGRTGVQIDGRTELEDMLDDASKQLFSVLIIEELSRLARDGEDTFRIYRLLACYGVDLYESSTGIKLDLIALVFKAFLAEKERLNFLTRARHGRRTAVSNGEIMHFANYGYMRDPIRPKRLLKHPENASAIQDIFTRAANGDRAYTISNDISGLYPTPVDCRNIAKGLVPPSTRSQWEPTSLQRIVGNPIYAGMVLDGRTVMVHDPDDYNCKAQIPVDSEKWQRVNAPELAIVSLETWLKAQEAFTSQGKSKAFGQGHRYLLKDLTFCARCSQPVKIALRGEYECFSRRTQCCGIGHLPAVQLERKVLNLLADVCRPTQDVSSDLGSRAAEIAKRSNDDFREALQHELAVLEQELNDGIIALCRIGDASQEKIEHWRRLEQRIEELRKRISLLRKSSKADSLPSIGLAEYLRNWESDTPFSCDDPRGDEIVKLVESKVDRVVIDLWDHEFRVEVHLRDKKGDTPLDGPAALTLVGTFPNLDTHDDGIRARVLSERTTAFERLKPNATDCVHLTEEMERHQGEVRTRLQAVLTCIDGSTCRDVAACIGRSEHHVLQWLIVFRDRGPSALLEESASAIESAARACVISGNDTLKTDADTTIVKNRLHLNENVMLLAVEGVTPAEIASRMKITRQLVFTILIGLEVAGYEGTLKARAPRTKLTEADLAVIRAVIAAGVDPFDAGSALTQKSLLKYCKEQFQIKQAETTLRNFLSRKGIRVSDAPKLGLSNRDREGRNMRDFVVRHLAP